MSWIQIEIQSCSSKVEQLEALLMNLGACSVTFMDAKDHPVYEPLPGTTPLWDEIIAQGLFPADANIDKILLHLKNNEQGSGRICNVHTIEDRAWEVESTRDFKPLCFGDNLWVCPDWCTPPDPEAVNIILNPGCGFGTGTHPTTAMCLQWLAKQNLQGQNVIDYGCGSGILGIAAVLLGAKTVVAVDIDPQALDASQQNAKQNRIEKSVFNTFYPHEVKTIKNADILIANILSGPLIELSSDLASMVKPQGHIVLSGILESQANQVIKAYIPWFQIKLDKVEEEWVRLTGVKRH